MLDRPIAPFGNRVQAADLDEVIGSHEHVVFLVEPAQPFERIMFDQRMWDGLVQPTGVAVFRLYEGQLRKSKLGGVVGDANLIIFDSEDLVYSGVVEQQRELIETLREHYG